MSASSPPAKMSPGSKIVPIRAARPVRTLRPTHTPRPGGQIAIGMTYELAIDSFFGASHSMRPNGERHTHSFRVQAAFVTDHIDENGMTVGFREVSDLLDYEARKYSNQYLNDLKPFRELQSTGENLAALVFHNVDWALQTEIPHGPKLVAVTLWENPTSYIKVSRTGRAA